MEQWSDLTEVGELCGEGKVVIGGIVPLSGFFEVLRETHDPDPNEHFQKLARILVFP